MNEVVRKRLLNVLVILLLTILLCSCASQYRSVNACALVSKAPIINNPTYIVDKEPKLADWVIILKRLRKLNNCK